MSIVIDNSGLYERDEKGLLKKTNHQAYQARVELALPKGKWLHAPNSGHDLDKFKRLKKTPLNEEEFEKKIIRYLEKYDPQVIDRVSVRENFLATIEIEDGA